MAKAHKDWLDACYGSQEIEQRDLIFQQVGRLERIARKAENAGQFSAAVGAITAFNRMMALGADQKGFRGHSNHHYRRQMSQRLFDELKHECIFLVENLSRHI